MEFTADEKLEILNEFIKMKLQLDADNAPCDASAFKLHFVYLEGSDEWSVCRAHFILKDSLNEKEAEYYQHFDGFESWKSKEDALDAWINAWASDQVIKSFEEMRLELAIAGIDIKLSKSCAGQ